MTMRINLPDVTGKLASMLARRFGLSGLAKVSREMKAYRCIEL